MEGVLVAVTGQNEPESLVADQTLDRAVQSCRQFAFPRDKKDTKWTTLADVDVVLAVSVDDGDGPTFANVHWLDAKEVRERFDRADAARKAAGHSIPLGRGIWVSLYRPEADEPEIASVAASVWRTRRRQLYL